MMFVISKRLYNCIAQTIFFILVLVLVIPVQSIYARNVVSFVRVPTSFSYAVLMQEQVIFSIFIQGMNYMTENVSS